MKVLIISLLCTISFISCQKTRNTNKQTSEDIKHCVNTILNNWHKDAAKAKFNKYFEAMDSTSIFIGTDASENWSKKEFKNFSKPYFDKGKAWDFKPLKRNIYLSKGANIVWFDELLDTWMGICRGSGVLEKSNNQWKIKQYVLSIAIPNDCTKEVVNIKMIKDSIFINSLK